LLCTQHLSAELVLVQAFTQRHVPFLLFQHLNGVIRRVFHGSNVAAKWQCSRDKARNLVVEAIAPMLHDKLVELLRGNHFSILIDESTCVSVMQHMAVVVKVVDPKQGKVSSCVA
jgi:hypothetical protein